MFATFAISIGQVSPGLCAQVVPIQGEYVYKSCIKYISVYKS